MPTAVITGAGTPSVTDRFDTEETFAAAIKRCGGVAVAETLTTRSFDNADFYFPDANTIIELKCLTENGFAKQTYRDWMEDRYIDWVKRGLAPRRKPPFAFDLQQLPRECYEEVLRKIVTQLERNFVRKANRQIRETRHHFGMPQAHGVLAIANDGDLSLPPLYVQTRYQRKSRAQKTSHNAYYVKCRYTQNLLQNPYARLLPLQVRTRPSPLRPRGLQPDPPAWSMARLANVRALSHRTEQGRQDHARATRHAAVPADAARQAVGNDEAEAWHHHRQAFLTG